MGRAELTLLEGMNLCKRRRPEVEPIPAFVRQLKIYESRCAEMGMIRVTNDITEGDRHMRGQKRKVIGVKIGPARGPARGPNTSIIGPNKNPNKDGNDIDGTNSRTRTTPVIGPSLPPSVNDDGVSDASSLLELHKARAKFIAIGPQKKPLVPPLLHHLKDGEENDSNKKSDERENTCRTDVVDTHTIPK